MHPRSTRNRPIIGLNRKKLYTNNIYSPTRVLLVPEAFHSNRIRSDSFYIDGVSCQQLKDTICWGGLMLSIFKVEFWDGTSADLRPIVTVKIHAPTSWSPELFLQFLEKVSWSSKVLSLIHGYCIDGVDFPYVTINRLHHYFNSNLK
jgi:hypothetical protein